LFQPSPSDGGTDEHLFATLHRFVRIGMGELSRNRVDAAIGKIAAGIETDSAICSIGKIAGTAQPRENMVVCKHGRKTGYTEGFIFDEDLDVLISVDHNNAFRIAAFRNQFRIHAAPGFDVFASDGDSGSLVVDKTTREAIGLISSGRLGYAVANRIQHVMAELQIELL
jgi:hypothetical protein